MITGHKIAEKHIAAYESEVVDQDFEIGNSRFGIGIIMVLAGFIGVWGWACLISGMAQTTNIQEIGRGIITALTGI